MPLIGSLEQIKLSTVLQRIEAYAKTGLLIVKQGENSVELSFRQGQLMCVGPIRSKRTLGNRLLQAGVILQEAYQEVVHALGTAQQSETRTAIALIDLGFVNQESLYNWAAQEVSSVLQVLLTWITGEIYFEEGLQPPADRLLVALSVASLLPQQFSASTPRPISNDVSSLVVREQPKLRATAPAIPDTGTQHDASQFFDADAFAPISAKIQITPEQWRLFTRADGQTSLQMACQVLMMPPELVCRVAGELMALGLVTICMPGSGSPNERVPIPQSSMYTDLSNSYVAPTSNLGSNPFAPGPVPIETQSQWGNGGNGASFVVGGGWVVSASPSNSLQPSGPLSLSNKVYAQSGRQ